MTKLATQFALLVEKRRTLKRFDGRLIPKADLLQLLDWAILSPNHRLNQPWRFRVCEGKDIPAFLQELETKMGKENWPTYQSAADRLRSAGGFIDVAVLKEEPGIRDEENFAATSAAVQSILFGATALGWQSFWSTGKLVRLPETRELIGMPPNEHFVGSIWLGGGESPEAPKRKPVSEVTEFWSPKSS